MSAAFPLFQPRDDCPTDVSALSATRGLPHWRFRSFSHEMVTAPLTFPPRYVNCIECLVHMCQALGVENIQHTSVENIQHTCVENIQCMYSSTVDSQGETCCGSQHIRRCNCQQGQHGQGKSFLSTPIHAARGPMTGGGRPCTRCATCCHPRSSGQLPFGRASARRPAVPCQFARTPAMAHAGGWRIGNRQLCKAFVGT